MLEVLFERFRKVAWWYGAGTEVEGEFSAAQDSVETRVEFDGGFDWGALVSEGWPQRNRRTNLGDRQYRTQIARKPPSTKE